MHEIEEWIEAAIQNDAIEISRLPVEEAQTIVATAIGRFVNGNPRSWWMDLAVPCQRHDSAVASLSAILRPAEMIVYLIPETESESLPAYRGKIIDFDRLIQGCPFFEYYIVPPDMQWLLTESDHNQYVTCGLP